ncbi:MAG: hypothetical protein PHP39_01440 [Oscillospiraceae bacterium]|nr:hypothetical protein [Oscillospiraceae bacterium]
MSTFQLRNHPGDEDNRQISAILLDFGFAQGCDLISSRGKPHFATPVDSACLIDIALGQHKIKNGIHTLLILSLILIILTYA